MNLVKRLIVLYLIVFTAFSCSKTDNTTLPTQPETYKELTIFHINDPHGKLANFSKIKHIVDEEKKITNVLLVSSGDIFSGNPVVDNYEEKGFPMIDVMNKVGFDVSVIGNHEFDYGETILKDRFNQSQFEWVCANVDMNDTGIPEPKEFKTITVGGIKVTFLGLVETEGKDNDIIPSTHPWRVQNLSFQKYYNVIGNYLETKENEQSDLFIALTHLGEATDGYLANSYPIFDAIIGGHSHTIVEKTVSNTPIFQAGSNLNYLGKIKLKISDREIKELDYQLIDLDSYSNFDPSIKELTDTYTESANLDEVIGYASAYHSRSQVGCFYTDALRNEMNVDITFQNTGGIRADLNEGDITKREIFTIDPFNNGSVTYTMTVGEIKNFLKESGVRIYFSGFDLIQNNDAIEIYNAENQLLNNDTNISVGLNDYIPAVYDTYFTQTPTFLPNTTAETIINYLYNNSSPIDYTWCNGYFQYQQ